jgi:hypothetical protein
VLTSGEPQVLYVGKRATANTMADVAAKVTDYKNGRGPLDRVGLFLYRVSVLESEVVKPLVLLLLDTDELPVPGAQLVKALDAIESWLVRRVLVRATTKAYNQIFCELITNLRNADRTLAGDVVEQYLRKQTGESRYWPDDEELKRELDGLLAYRRISKGRLRMVLEAVEDHRRGWCDGKAGLGGERVGRGKYAIEHILPRRWQSHWPLSVGSTEAERERVLHTLGNLTLLTGQLNSKVSNGPWLGASGKRERLQQHDVLMLNRDVLAAAADGWTEEKIRKRTTELSRMIMEIWRVPDGHRSVFATDRGAARVRLKKVDLADLIGAGMLAPATTLHPKRSQYSSRVATVMADGQIDVDGKLYPTPRRAASAIAGKNQNGLSYFVVDLATKRTLKDLWREYIERLAVEADDDDDDDDDELDQE